jgi:hypothetical protein
MDTRSRLVGGLVATLSLAALTHAATPAAHAQPGGWPNPLDLLRALPLVIGPNEVFQAEATTLRANDAQEEGWLSNGDEPYVILAIVRTPVSGVGLELSVDQSTVFSGVDDGDTRNAARMLLNQHTRRGFGLAAQVVEDDDSDVGDLFDAASDAAGEAFDDAVDAGINNRCTIAVLVADAIHDTVADEADGIDPNDNIGAGASLCVTAGSLDDLAAGATAFRQLSFRGDGGSYTQHFRIRRVN